MDGPPLNVARESIVVNAPAAEVYERWLRVEDFPKFIKPMGPVRRIDDTHFSFMVSDGKENRQSVLEIMHQNPARRIAWRIMSDGVGLGVVSFDPQSDGSTEVTLKLRSAFNPLLSTERATEYLSDFKSLVESSPS